jgi:3-dehydroquinate synthetase
MQQSPKLIREWSIRSPDGYVSEIQVGRGVAVALAGVPDRCSRVAFFTQPPVATIAANLAEAASSDAVTDVREFPDGDAAKDLAVVADAYAWLNSLEFTRDDLIVAVGGGALTDVAGFVAATYLRGVQVAYLPTTLLGAVDAAIGGKTGINVQGKNLAGVFRHPQKVIVDLDLLDELPEALLAEGAAETIKAGFIAEPIIVSAYEAHGLGASLDVVVPEAIAVKVRTVKADFHESGLRAILNYGHTVGHAVEVAAGLPHGYAVAIGMVAAGAISEVKVGFEGFERQRKILEKIGLPTVSPPVDAGLVGTLMGRDKKRDRGGLRMVLLKEFGQPIVRHVTDDDLRVGLAAVGIDAA